MVAEIKFVPNESWTILSPIEQSIKSKIEAVGIPLKDWEINIYRGILTGYNEAFIINGKTKERLVSEDPKSAEIIRPILRGRDIKRYGYEFSDLYLITTFPSLKIDIDKYPSIKRFLLSFGIERLEQTGREYKINGECIKARKKTANKWFETQDSISYWEDFSKQKIIFQEMVQESSFILDNEGKFLCLDTARIITGERLEVILAVLNSKLFYYSIKNFYGGGGLGANGIRMKHTFFENFPMPKFSMEIEDTIKTLVSNPTNENLHLIDELLYNFYGFNENEVQLIEFQ